MGSDGCKAIGCPCRRGKILVNGCERDIGCAGIMEFGTVR